MCLILLILSVVLFVYQNFLGKGDFDKVTLYCDGKEIRTFSLSENEDYYGIDGTVISVFDGKVFIKSTDCPDKTCQMMSPVTSDGGNIVCVPKKLVIKSEKNNTRYDTIVG